MHLKLSQQSDYLHQNFNSFESNLKLNTCVVADLIGFCEPWLMIAKGNLYYGEPYIKVSMSSENPPGLLQTTIQDKN